MHMMRIIKLRSQIRTFKLRDVLLSLSMNVRIYQQFCADLRISKILAIKESSKTNKELNSSVK